MIASTSLNEIALQARREKDSLVLFSPAKLNLFFRVLRKREDGFHEIASLFQAIDLGDFLHIQKAEKDFLTCTDPTIPTDPDNLVLQGAELFRKKTGLAAYARYHIEKQIPVQAGLGGGSSNLASALWGLRNLYAPEIATSQLQEWVSEISSDAAFFFSSGRAYCTGRGEKIADTCERKENRLWVAKPTEGLSTPSVYKNCNPNTMAFRDVEEVKRSFQVGDPSYFNDLEESAFSLLPKLSLYKEKLLSLGFDEVVMTGSGTAFFCIGEKENEPKLDGIHFYPVQFLFRDPEMWYQPKCR